MAVEAIDLGRPIPLDLVLPRQRERIIKPSLADQYLKGPACLVGANILQKIVSNPSMRDRIVSYLVVRKFDPYNFAESHGATGQQLSDIEDKLEGMTPEGQVGLSLVFLPGILKMKARQFRGQE